MAIDTTVEKFIKNQEEKTISTSDIQSKFNSEVQDITIREIGLYHHPTVMVRDTTEKRLSKHLRLGGDYESFQELGTFEYEKINYPNTPAIISLLGFVLDENTEYSTEEYTEWIEKNRVSDGELEDFIDWSSTDETEPLNSIYAHQDEALWNIEDSGIYEKGALTPLLSAAIVFEDESGVFYTGVVPVDIYADEIKQLFQESLNSKTVTAETDTSDDTEGTKETTEENEIVEYVTEDTEASIRSNTIQFEEFTIELECIFSPNWYSIPFLTHAFDIVTEESYDLLQTAENGWFKTTAKVEVDQIPSRNQLNISLPYDSMSLPWNASFEENHIVRELCDGQITEDRDEIEVAVRSPYTATQSNVGPSYAASNSYVWIVAPTERIKMTEMKSQDAEESDEMQNDAANTQQPDSNITQDETTVSSKQSLLERLGFK